MRAGGLLLVLTLSALTTFGQAAVGKLKRYPVFGIDYVRLEDWAAANGYQVQWTRRNEEIKLTRAGVSIEFDHNSRRAVVNGVNVWLSVPITLRQGSAYIAPMDLRTAIEPILFPPVNLKSRPIRSIILDPGHGGKDPGNREGSYEEKKYALLLAKDLAPLLTKAGFKVSLTRNTDAWVDLPVRPDLARRRGADLFVSLHFNSADGPGGKGVSGAEVYAMTPARASSTNARGEGAGTGPYPGNWQDPNNMLLAFQIQKALVQKCAAADRGVKRARFWVLRDATMPAVLIEAAFMTNPLDLKKITGSNERLKMAQTICDGILAYRRMVDGVSGTATRVGKH